MCLAHRVGDQLLLHVLYNAHDALGRKRVSGRGQQLKVILLGRSEITVRAIEIPLRETEISVVDDGVIITAERQVIIDYYVCKMDFVPADRARQQITAAAFAAKYRSKREV